MKLNLGCGSNQVDGWLNVDCEDSCNPDRVVNLEQLPWPFDDDAASQVAMIHVLEHVGKDPAIFLGIIKELYRVCAPGAEVRIKVPHPRHDTYLSDPTHVRPITLPTLQMFDQEKNLEWRKSGASNTPLGLFTGVDFRIARFTNVLDPTWQELVSQGAIKADDIPHAMRTYNNVVQEIDCTLEAMKPARGS